MMVRRGKRREKANDIDEKNRDDRDDGYETKATTKGPKRAPRGFQQGQMVLQAVIFGAREK